MTDEPTPTVQAGFTRHRHQPIAVGDRVQYKAEFLRSTGQHTGPIPFARGIVTALQPLGQTTLAVVDWGTDDVPPKVNVANLERTPQQRGIK